jgi:hypothetical protein
MGWGKGHPAGTSCVYRAQVRWECARGVGLKASPAHVPHTSTHTDQRRDGIHHPRDLVMPHIAAEIVCKERATCRTRSRQHTQTGATHPGTQHPQPNVRDAHLHLAPPRRCQWAPWSPAGWLPAGQWSGPWACSASWRRCSQAAGLTPAHTFTYTRAQSAGVDAVEGLGSAPHNGVAKHSIGVSRGGGGLAVRRL